MENISLFVTSIIIYFLVTEIYEPTSFFLFFDVFDVSRGLKKLGIIALLCLPINIDGNVFTVAGNAVAEKNIFSVFSFFQEAKNGSAVSILGIGNVQIVEKNALTFLGFPFYQRANRAFVAFGGAIFQVSKEMSTVNLGIAVYQRSEKTTGIDMGIAGYQNAGKKAESLFALTLYQKVQNKNRSFAVFSSLTAPESVPKPEQKNK